MDTRLKRYHFHKSTFSTFTFDMLFSESRADPPIEQVLATRLFRVKVIKMKIKLNICFFSH